MTTEAVPVKINVSIAIGEPTLTQTVAVNIAVRQITESVVAFGDGGNSVPHVTIAMGTVRDEKAIDGIADELSGQAAGLGRFELTFGRIYRETQTGRYVFSDVIGPETFLQWRQRFRMTQARWFTEEARTSDAPHLTIAHVERDLERVDALLKVAQPLAPCRADAVDVALSGPKGRRLGLLRSVQLDQ